MASSAPSVSPASLQLHLTCSICMDIFEDPVATVCGHSFCKSCLSKSISNNPTCPLCKHPVTMDSIGVNIVLRNIAQKVEKTQKKHNLYTGAPGEVACDLCTETKLTAEKSCLVCLASYCSIHLEAHSTTKRLKGHRLVDPVENMDQRACPTHGRPLELYCRKQQRCICALCVEEGQEVVTVEAEWDIKKAGLNNTKTELEHKLKKREKKAEEIRESLRVFMETLDDEWWEIDGVFSILMNIVEVCQNKALQPLKDRRDVVETEAKKLTEELQSEISDLIKTISELEDISAVEDHVHFLQTYPFISNENHDRDWTRVDLDTTFSFGTIRDITTNMMEHIQEHLEKLTSIELKRVTKFAVDVKLDPATAHTRFIVSDDGKEVKDGGKFQKVPGDDPERFNLFGSILGLNKLTSGKSYWEIEVGKKTGWELGVARGNANRRGQLSLSPDNGYWVAVHYDNNQYTAMTSPPVSLSLAKKPQKVGVFLDYEKGLVSFYDVKAGSHIYSFTGCSFTGELCPYFSPHLIKKNKKNIDPLIISAVKHH